MTFAATSRLVVLTLYKQLLREGSKFPSYNYREYAFRRTRDAFRNNRNLTEEEAIKRCIVEAMDNLEVIRKQVIIGTLYSADKLVIEK